MISRLLIFVFAFISFTVNIFAQESSLPESAMGARTTALGRTATLSFSDALSVSSNPASISYAQRASATGFYTKLPYDVTSSSLGFVHQLKDRWSRMRGVIGASYYRLGTEFTTADLNGNIENQSYVQNHFLLSYGVNLGDKFAVGASAKAVWHTMGPYNSPVKNIGLDFGLQYHPGFSGAWLQNFGFGLAIDNLVKPILKYNIHNGQDRLPRAYRFIVENRIDWGKQSIIFVANLVSSGIIFSEDSRINRFHAGLEYNYKNFSLRGGLHNQDFKYGLRQSYLAFGAGYRISSFVIDYAFSKNNLSHVDGNNSLAVSLVF